MSKQVHESRGAPHFWHVYFLVLALVLAFWYFAAIAARAAASHASFNSSRSWYVDGNYDQDDMLHLGCDTANKHREGYATLFFGAPIRVDDPGGGYKKGVTRFSATDVPFEGDPMSVKALVKDFIEGYDTCADPGEYLVVGVGVSNCSIGGGNSECPGGQSYKTNAWVEAHGAKLAEIIDDIRVWMDPYYLDHAAVRGAWDMEPAWASYSKTDLWMDGYEDGTLWSLLGNYSSDGCEDSRVYNSAVDQNCANGYKYSSMWHLVDQHVVEEIPQIYTESQAIRWMRIEEYGNHAKGNGLYFIGVMAGEGTSNDTVHKAHEELWDELNNPAGHSPNHASQSMLGNGTLLFAMGHGLHDH